MSIEALVQDEAGRELLGLLCKLDTACAAALVGYLSLFRSDRRDLSNDKALRLANEALALGPLLTVAQAMQKTVDNLRAQCSQKLSNHNYLKKVRADTQVNTAPHHLPDVGKVEIGYYLDSLTVYSKPVKPSSKTGQALDALEKFGNE